VSNRRADPHNNRGTQKYRRYSVIQCCGEFTHARSATGKGEERGSQRGTQTKKTHTHKTRRQTQTTNGEGDNKTTTWETRKKTRKNTFDTINNYARKPELGKIKKITREKHINSKDGLKGWV